MQKSKLVTRAEITVLGTVALALFCSSHVPEFLSTLDTSISTPAAYSASAAAPYVEDSTTVPAPIAPANSASAAPVATADLGTASSTPATTITVTSIAPAAEVSDPTESQ